MRKSKNFAMLGGMMINAFLIAILLANTAYSTTGDVISYSVGGVDVFRITQHAPGFDGLKTQILPGVANGMNLGSAALPIANVYASNLTTGIVTSSTDALALTNLTVGYSFKVNSVTVTANATLANTVQVFVGTITGDRTYTLPTPSAGAVMDIQDSLGTVGVAGNVTIKAAGGTYLNGALAGTKTITSAYGGAKFFGIDATHWACR